VKISYAWQSHLGLVRPQNEDAWGVRPRDTDQDLDEIPYLFAVADGMGGHPGGEVASSLAVGVVVDPTFQLGPGEPPETLRSLFTEAARRIRDEGERDPRRREMGTTLTVLYLRSGRAWVGHIGDTRLYWIRGSEARQITRDHTMAQDLVDAGLLDARFSERHPSSHILTRCLGVCPDQRADLLKSPLRLRAGDRLLLASDGLVKVVAPDLLSDLMVGHGAQEATNLLVEAALQGGAPDNVTVISVTILESDEVSDLSDTVPLGSPLALDWLPV
jgi:PPM family protein phosphatase